MRIDAGTAAMPPFSWRLAEAVFACLAAAVAAALLPLNSGFFAISWDALNHHIYLGLLAETGRLQQDVIAASYQSYQYPYLYWPVYRMFMLSGDGKLIGAAWAAVQVFCLMPAVWLIAYRLIPQGGSFWRDSALRLVACALAMMNTIILSVLDSTGNDVLAAVPLIWAIAIMTAAKPTHANAAVAAGLYGVSAAFKLSNAVFLPVLFVWVASIDLAPFGRAALKQFLKRSAAIGIGALIGFSVSYAPWGFQLWKATGDPFYPYLQNIFQSNASPARSTENAAVPPSH